MQREWHILVTNDVGDHDTTSRLQDSVHFAEDQRFVRRVDEIENAVGNDQVDRVVGDQRRLGPLSILPGAEAIQVLHGLDRLPCQVFGSLLQIAGQVLDAGLVERDVGIAETVGDFLLILASQL